MSSGLHPHIMFDLAASTMAERQRVARDRDQRAAARRADLRSRAALAPGSRLVETQPTPRRVAGVTLKSVGALLCGEGQLVVSDVSSTRKLVAAEESSTPRNFTVTVLPV